MTMAYLIARVELSDADARFPAVGDEVFLGAELQLSDGDLKYFAQLSPLRDADDVPTTWGYLRTNGGFEEYALGTGRIVPLKKVKRSESRFDRLTQLMRVQIEGSVSAARERAEIPDLDSSSR